MRIVWRHVIVILPAVFGLTLASCSIFDEFEERCRREAQVIIHDQELWREYLREAEQTYQSRAKEFPETGRVVAEYAPSFEQKFGRKMKDRPVTVDGAVVREDIYIVQQGKPVAQFVNLYARQDFAGSTIEACIGSFPELYSEAVPLNQ